MTQAVQKKIVKLGTRKSLLAWAQSSIVAETLEAKNPDIKVKLVGIVTRGDKVLDIPLSQIEGKEFFVKEIDEALLENRVDFTVHSMKDLSADRPDEVCLGAVPKREDPRDVILFNRHVKDSIAQGRTLRIGTSSPRRLQNLPDFLKNALPQMGGSSPEFEFVEIRGNVNTRLGRVREDFQSDNYLDGVVLAFAGLSRLSQHPSSSKEIFALLQDLHWMVLPLSENPTSPAQGALAIECRSDDESTKAILKTIHDESSALQVGSERTKMLDYGGGCHQRFGLTSVNITGLGAVMFKKGLDQTSKRVDGVSWPEPQNNPEGPFWDGRYHKAKSTQQAVDFKQHECSFVANAKAIESIPVDHFKNSRIWVSGCQSWFKLAAKGIWVEGCGDGLGFESIRETLNKKVLQLAPMSQWGIYTHDAALSSWGEATAYGTYQLHYDYDESTLESLRLARSIYWSSPSQFEACKLHVNDDAVHCCGAGKTAMYLRKQNLSRLAIYPQYQQWHQSQG